MLRGMSQEKLGEALGVTFQQVQKYEKGANRIGVARLQQIAKILGVAPSFFFEGLSVAVPAESSHAPGFEDSGASVFETDFLSTSEGLQLNRAFFRIKDAKVRKRLVELVTAIADSVEPRKTLDENFDR
jgi:transcriptional regulator with XRE-family HTH domain